MPEIAEVARLVHFLRQHLVGKKIFKVEAPDDANIFGKVGCSGPAFEKALTGRKVLEAGSQGKYFWLRLNDPGPHPVMHLGMTGWIHVQGARTAYTNYYKKMKPDEQETWPPKYWNFQLETQGKKPVRIAFTDPRRFGRIRLVDCPGDQIRQNSPLVENGPDPVVDKNVFTEDYLRAKMRKRHVPVKALILDQAVISGVGNWVADESLYQAKLHPEQYCNEFSDEEINRLHEAIRYVCQTAIDLLGDSDQFPDHWLFNHRWGKGKKQASVLPNGEKLAFISVGGRTSCYAPAVQKKTGNTVPGVKEEVLEDVTSKEGKKSESNDEKAKGKGTDQGDVRPEKRRRTTPKNQNSEEDDKTDIETTRSRKKTMVKKQAADGESKILKTTALGKTSDSKSDSGSSRRRSARLNRS